MARGITESDVHTAADEIVAAGDRPTVERIRARMGTGSPNTVTRWLETWWQRLGLRLEAQRRRIGVPEAPEAVMALAGEWWALALEHARSTAAEALTHERNALQGVRDTLRQEREDFEAEAAALREKIWRWPFMRSVWLLLRRPSCSVLSVNLKDMWKKCPGSATLKWRKERRSKPLVKP